MGCYISSNENRFYACRESEYGTVPAITAANRLPATGLRIRQDVEAPRRRDKTGGRTFTGLAAGLRRTTTFELSTLLVSWGSQPSEPGYGPLFEGALGAAPLTFGGGTVQSMPEATRLVFAEAHGLSADQAVAVDSEIRFAAGIVDATTIILNAPLSVTPPAGTPVTSAMTYMPANHIPSLSVFDYWDPSDTVHRVLTGAAVDRLHIRVNGDFHEFAFAGIGRDVIDNLTFSGGQGGLESFPEEPEIADWNYTAVPGNLGQAWLGASPEQFFSILEASVVVDNHLDARSREFGSEGPRCIAPGLREVNVEFRLFANSRAETKGLYEAARQRSPISVMFQLGQTPGHLCGVYMKSVVPEMPEFDDSETRLQWRFRSCRAQGSDSDELVVAFA